MTEINGMLKHLYTFWKVEVKYKVNVYFIIQAQAFTQ